MLIPEFETFPPALTAVPQWLLWRLQTRNGKATKVPLQPDGRAAKVDDPATWNVYETARAAYLANPHQFSGVGFVLTAADPVVGIDLDHCIDLDTGALTPEATAIVAALPTYCEVSPSGQGLRLFARGNLPPGRRRRGPVEMYDAARYLTVTGHRFNAIPDLADCTAELATLHGRIFGVTPPAPPSPTTRAASVRLADAAVIKKGHAARNGGDFARLWEGDAAAYDGDESAADLALCNALAFWTGNDADQMDRLFRCSGLFRAKWDERRGESGTYGQMTIAKAIQGSRETYHPRKNSTPTLLKPPSRPSRPSRGNFSEENQSNDGGHFGTDGDFTAVPAVPETVPDGFPAPYFFMVKADKTVTCTFPNLPERHKTASAGLYYVPVEQVRGDRGTSSKHGAPLWISMPFDLLATTDDGQGHGHGIAIRFTDIHHHDHLWTLPRGLLVMEGRELFAQLYGMGFHMSLSDRSFQRLRDYLNRARAEVPDLPRALSVSRTGWAPGNRFVLPDQVFGTNGVALYFQSDDPRPSPYTLHGTLDGWRETVSMPLAGFDLPVFSISCAFAGPLLEPFRIESGGFHYEGATTTGKSSIQRVALSVWGNVRELAQTWNGTRVGMELVTAAYSDTLLVLDEIGQADPRAIGEVVYMICNEYGRTRGNARLTHRANLRWRTLLLSSGEKSLSGIMATAGVLPAAGQEVRLAHIPVDIDGAGVLTGLLDKPAREDLLRRVKQQQQEHYGHAARAFLERMTGGGLPDPDEDAALVRDLAATLAGPDSTNEVSRVALRFALVGYAGEMATRWGITGWPKGRALEASTLLFKRWRAHWGTGRRDESLFLLHLDVWLAEHSTGSFVEVEPETMREHRKLPALKPFYGYSIVKDAVRTFYINAAGFKDLTKQVGSTVALNALRRTRRLIAGGEGDGGKREVIAGVRQRFYILTGAD